MPLVTDSESPVDGDIVDVEDCAAEPAADDAGSAPPMNAKPRIWSRRQSTNSAPRWSGSCDSAVQYRPPVAAGV
jgi:hypothetical protein